MIESITQLWEFIKQLWAHAAVKQVSIAVVTAIVTALLTHISESRKLRKQQDIAFQESLGKKIVDAYIKTREIVLQLETIEALPESIQFSRENREKAEELLYYPAIMEDIQTASEYCMKVSDTRRQFEPYLSNKAAAFLLILERYLMEVATFVVNYKLQDRTKRVGILVHPDLQKIEKAFDNVIVNEINKPRYYLETKSTWKYKLTKAILKKKYIDNSILMDILDKDIMNTISHINSEKERHES